MAMVVVEVEEAFGTNTSVFQNALREAVHAAWRFSSSNHWTCSHSDQDKRLQASRPPQASRSTTLARHQFFYSLHLREFILYSRISGSGLDW